MNVQVHTRKIVKLVREGNLAADVEVCIVEDDDLFTDGPYLPPEEAKKLDAVRHALRNGDIKTATHLAKRVYALEAVEAGE